MEISDTGAWLLYGGLVFGLAFGFVLQRSRFCLLSALSNFLMFRDWRQAHAWMIAIAVAVAGVTYLEFAGLVDVAQSSFRQTAVSVGGSLLGGLVFGIGAVLAGGCASRTLIRVSEGNFGSLIALACFGVAGMVTLFGVFAPARDYLVSHSQLDVFAGELSIPAVLGQSPTLVAGLLVASLLASVFLTGRAFRDWRLLAAGAFIGLLVMLGWWYTGYLLLDEFEPHAPFTVSVSGPLARTTLWLTTDTLTASWFGITLVFGMLAGGLVSAVTSRTWHWVVPDAVHVPHLIFGGSLMGVGAVFAGGCNVGQGLAGMSTLSCSSLVALISILLGMRLGLLLINLDELHRDKQRPAVARQQQTTLPTN